METLPKDIIKIIFASSNKSDIINVTSVSVKMYEHRDYFFENFPISGEKIDFMEVSFTGSIDRVKKFLDKIVYLRMTDTKLINYHNFDNVRKIYYAAHSYNTELLNRLPSGTTELEFNNHFRGNVNNIKPRITHLTFGWAFDKPIDHLPDTVTHLTFGRNFNQPVDNLPSSLTHLTFGRDFNKPVDKLSSSIINLKFGNRFNQPVDNLPYGITHITFGDREHMYINDTASDFDQPLDKLPSSVVEVTLHKKYKHMSTVPKGIKIITYTFTPYYRI